MNWTAWVASKHTLMVHLPIAAALMIPIPIIAAQRAGRGIRPWWITCRYLAGAGLLGSILAVVSGFLQGHPHLHGPAHGLLALARLGWNDLVTVHAALGVASLVLGALCLRSLFRERLPHQGIGLAALLLGWLWCGSALTGAYSGALLEGHGTPPARFLAHDPAALPAVPAKQASPLPIEPSDLEASLPVRLLDYASLKPIHAEPMKSAAHGNRWLRVWVTPAAAKAYQAGQALPPGTLVVVTTVEDRYGRPGFEPGPMYGLEVAPDGRPRLTFYWAQVPEARRKETHGEARAYWRNEDSSLDGCRACHEKGAAPLRERTRTTLPRKGRT